MAREVATIKYIFNSVLNFMNQSFLHSVPAVINSLIALLLTALFIFSFLLLLCFIVGTPYYFIKNYFQKMPEETLIDVFKKTFIFIGNRIKHPITNGVVANIIYKNLPLIAILFCCMGLWKDALPMLALSLFFNSHISNKINYKIEGFLLIFLLILLYVHWGIIWFN